MLKLRCWKKWLRQAIWQSKRRKSTCKDWASDWQGLERDSLVLAVVRGSKSQALLQGSRSTEVRECTASRKTILLLNSMKFLNRLGLTTARFNLRWPKRAGKNGRRLLNSIVSLKLREGNNLCCGYNSKLTKNTMNTLKSLKIKDTIATELAELLALKAAIIKQILVRCLIYLQANEKVSKF